MTVNGQQESGARGTPFLTAYDYGQGALWAYVIADSAEAIEQAYPELEVLSAPPPWMDAEEFTSIRTIHLTDQEDPFLLAIRMDRRSGEL